MKTAVGRMLTEPVADCVTRLLTLSLALNGETEVKYNEQYDSISTEVFGPDRKVTDDKQLIKALRLACEQAMRNME